MPSKPDLLVLLGAGASIHAGMPSVKEITYRLLECSESNSQWVARFDAQRMPGYKASVDVVQSFDKVREYLEAYDNYEQFLGYLENVSLFNSHHGSIPPINVYTATVNTILDAFQVKPKYKALGDMNYRKLFDNYRLLIFTLNYDIVSEGYAQRVGEIPSDGFLSTKGTEPAKFSRNTMSSDIHAGRSIVAHLHGCILYSKPYANRGPIRFVKHQTPEMALDARLDEFVSSSSRGGRHFFVSTIISGTNKSDAIRGTPVMRHYMREFGRLCKTAKRILIIGYGGNDAHINKHLDAAYRNNKEVKIAFVTRSPLDYPYPPREVFAALPSIKPLQTWGTDWLSIDEKVRVKTGKGFPLEDENIQSVLKHLGP